MLYVKWRYVLYVSLRFDDIIGIGFVVEVFNCELTLYNIDNFCVYTQEIYLK